MNRHNWSNLAHMHTHAYCIGLPLWLRGKESAHAREAVSIPGSERSPEEGNSNLLQYYSISHSATSDSLWPHGLYVVRQAPLSGKECWSGLPIPSSGDLSSPGIEHASLALAGGSFTVWANREAQYSCLGNSMDRGAMGSRRVTGLSNWKTTNAY